MSEVNDALFFLKEGFKSASLFPSYCAFYNSKNLNCIGALCFFLRSVHTFFNDFDLSNRDKQVKPSGH